MERLTLEEFDNLINQKGIDAGKEYLKSIINELSDEDVKNLFFEMKDAARGEIVSLIQANEKNDIFTKEQLSDIAFFLSVKRMGEEDISVEDTLGFLMAAEDMNLNRPSFQRIVKEYKSKNH